MSTTRPTSPLSSATTPAHRAFDQPTADDSISQIIQALASPSEDSVAHASLVVAQAKVLSAESALLAASKLFELAGSRSVSAKYNLDRHWRNARNPASAATRQRLIPRLS